MSSGVLFDAPGPATRRRHRLYSLVTLAALVALLAYAGWRLYDTGQFAGNLWEPFYTPKYVNAILFDGILQTLKMAFTAVAGAVIFGVLFGIGKLSEHAWLRWPCWAVVEFFRAVPVIMLMLFIFYGPLDSLGLETGRYWAVVVALMLYNGAVLAEVFRAGILALPKGQAEAAYAIGMRKNQVMRIVLLPQAVKIMIPAIISQCVVALKDTSLGYIITAPGLTRVLKQIYGEFNNYVPAIIVLAGLYILINLGVTALATLAQKRLVGEKKPLTVSMVGADPNARV